MDSTDQSPEVRVTEDGSRTLFDVAANQTLHSMHGAVSEARHVYLQASGVRARLEAGLDTTVIEVGLGTGLNLLLTLDAAVATGARVTYRALERTLLTTDVVASMRWGEHLEHPELVDAWLEVLEMLHRGAGKTQGEGPRKPYRMLCPLPSDGILEVAFGDATDTDGAPWGAARDLLARGEAHAIYHDAFSPEASPTLWSEGFLSACAAALAPGGTWVSYSVAGSVRRALATAGLEVHKEPGPPGGKRDMLRAVRPADPE